MDAYDLYEQVYSRLDTYVKEYSEYSPKVLKSAPLTIYSDPVVIVKKPEELLRNETLKKTEQKLDIDFDIEIYTKDKANVNKAVITTELRQLVDYVMFDELGMNRTTDRNIPNIDTDVDRQLLRYNCILDRDRKIIFRR